MPSARSDENSAALSADLRAAALFDVRGKVVVLGGYKGTVLAVGTGAVAGPDHLAGPDVLGGVR